MSRIPSLVVTCTALCMMQVGCNRTTKSKPMRQSSARSAAKPVSVPIFTVQQKKVVETVTIPATIVGYAQAHMMAKIDGYVKTVHVNIGDEVDQGTVLIELDVPELGFAKDKADRMFEQAEADLEVRNAELRAATAKLHEQQALVDLRQSEHGRIARLVQRGALKPQKLEEARFALTSAKSEKTSVSESLAVAKSRVEMASKQIEVARAEVAQSEALARYSQVTAPFTGVITLRTVDPGSFVRPANSGGEEQPMLTIASVDQVRAIAHLTMDQSGKLDDGDATTFTAVDVPDRVFSGVISRHAKSYDAATRMMRAEVDLSNAKDATSGRRTLRPGGYGTLTITVDSQNLPAVPKSALFDQNGAHCIVRVDPAGKCRRQVVHVAVRGKDWIGVRYGVRGGDRVVAEKADKVDVTSRITATKNSTRK